MSPYIEELDISIQWKQEPPAKLETPVSQKLEAPVSQSLKLQHRSWSFQIKCWKVLLQCWRLQLHKASSSSLAKPELPTSQSWSFQFCQRPMLPLTVRILSAFIVYCLITVSSNRGLWQNWKLLICEAGASSFTGLSHTFIRFTIYLCTESLAPCTLPVKLIELLAETLSLLVTLRPQSKRVSPFFLLKLNESVI